MTPLDLRKLQNEYKRVNTARDEQEVRIIEMQEQIDRILASIEVSKAKEDELLSKIQAAQEALKA